MYAETPYGNEYTELRENMTFSPFLFRFLIITFYNFCYAFTVYYSSVYLRFYILTADVRQVNVYWVHIEKANTFEGKIG